MATPTNKSTDTETLAVLAVGKLRRNVSGTTLSRAEGDALVALVEQHKLLIKDLHSALARERGGGTPLTHKQYIDLRKRVLSYD